MASRSSWKHQDLDPCTTLHFPFSPSAPSMARKLMIEDLARSSVRQTVIDDAETVLAELVANAVEHGRPDASGEIEVSWCLHDDHLLISVLDSGVAISTFDAERLTDDALRGRGLAMVDLVCDRWMVETDHGVRVTAELNFSSESVDA